MLQFDLILRRIKNVSPKFNFLTLRLLRTMHACLGTRPYFLSVWHSPNFRNAERNASLIQAQGLFRTQHSTSWKVASIQLFKVAFSYNKRKYDDQILSKFFYNSSWNCLVYAILCSALKCQTSGFHAVILFRDILSNAKVLSTLPCIAKFMPCSYPDLLSLFLAVRTCRGKTS